MKFQNYLTERTDNYGLGITFIDIDETLFNTFAKILVMKDGEVVNKLNNQEFNTYTLQNGESYNFKEFRDANVFNKTSIPIPKTINRVKRMLSQIKKMESKSKIIFLSARADFDDDELFKKTFIEHGIDINNPNVKFELVGNIKTGTIKEKKKQVIFKYLKTGLYRRVRLIDDDIENINGFKSIEDEIPQNITNSVIKTYNLDVDNETIPIISFYALLVKPNGSLQGV